MRATSTCSAPRKCGRSCARPTPSRTARLYLTAAFTGLRRGELLALRYLHYAPREEDTRLVAEAFRLETAKEPETDGHVAA